MGVQEMGVEQIGGYLRKKALFSSVFLEFPGVVKGRKGRFRPISRKGGQTPLQPPFVTRPFAAALKQSVSSPEKLFRYSPGTLTETSSRTSECQRFSQEPRHVKRRSWFHSSRL